MANLRIVLPGDEVPLSSLGIGPGLHVLEEEDHISTVSIAGLLKGGGMEAGSNKRTWVDYSAKRVSIFMELPFFFVSVMPVCILPSTLQIVSHSQTLYQPLF